MGDFGRDLPWERTPEEWLSDEDVRIQKFDSRIANPKIRSVSNNSNGDSFNGVVCIYTTYLLCTNLQIYERSIYETCEKCMYIACQSRFCTAHYALTYVADATTAT
jgi:hypothetical protein